MSNTLKSAIPVALISAVLVALFFVGYSFWFKERVLTEIAESQRTDIVDLRAAYQAEMEKFAERILARVDETNKTLDAAIASSAGELFVAEGEARNLDAQKVSTLADAVMNRLNSVIPTADEQDRSYDAMTSRVSDKLTPILSDIARTGNLTRSDVEFYSSQITGLIDGVLKEELAEKQRLNNSLLQTSAVAQDSLRLSQEMSALYLSSLKDEGVISRILSLPVRVVQDVSSLSIVGSSDRRKMEERLFHDLDALEKRLAAAQGQEPPSAEKPRKFEVTESSAATPVAAAPVPAAPKEAPIREKPTSPAAAAAVANPNP
ncbi:MAG TPA: hypothetical protein VGA56_11505 [Opitutaceae bacterium]